MRNKSKKKTRKKKGAGKNLSKPKQIKEKETEKELLNPHLLDIIARYNTEIYTTILEKVAFNELARVSGNIEYKNKLERAIRYVESLHPHEPREQYLDHLFALKTANYLGSHWVNYQHWESSISRGWMSRLSYMNPTSNWYIIFVYEPILDYDQIYGSKFIDKEKKNEVISRLITLSDPYHPLRYPFLMIPQMHAPQNHHFQMEAKNEHGWNTLPSTSMTPLLSKTKEKILKL